MPKGVTHDRTWHGQELIEEWLARQQAPLCACGCGQRVALKPSHRRRGIPRFILGHHARLKHWNFKGVEDWVRTEQGKHQCACGCGRFVNVVPRHHATGIPRFLPKHAPAPKLAPGPEHPAYKRDRSRMEPRKAAAFGEVTKRVVFNAFGGKCAWCGAEGATEFDHVVPVAQGGTGDIANAQLLCANCHMWKSRIEPHYRERTTRARPVGIETADPNEEALIWQ